MTIFFNQPILKHISDTTILNFFTEESGRSIFVRDTRKETYSGIYKIHADVKFYKKDGNFYIDLSDMTSYDGQTMGVFIGEGFDFEIKTTSEPLFVVKQDKTSMSLAELPWLQNKSVNQATLGMFTLGTTISFKVEGQPIKEELTKSGWNRTDGPKDKDLGIITIDEAFENKKKLDSVVSEIGISDSNLDLIERLNDAAKRENIPSHLAKSRIRMIKSKDNRDGKDGLFLFLKTEVELLRQYNLLK